MTIWDCKIGTRDDVALEMGSDFPMRQAIRDAYRQLTGREPEFLFSGWGGRLTASELSVINKKS